VWKAVHDRAAEEEADMMEASIARNRQVPPSFGDKGDVDRGTL
jgi:hypothetical protein